MSVLNYWSLCLKIYFKQNRENAKNCFTEGYSIFYPYICECRPLAEVQNLVVCRTTVVRTSFITDHVHSTRNGNAFTGVCHSVQGGTPFHFRWLGGPPHYALFLSWLPNSDRRNRDGWLWSVLPRRVNGRLFSSQLGAVSSFSLMEWSQVFRNIRVYLRIPKRLNNFLKLMSW